MGLFAIEEMVSTNVSMLKSFLIHMLLYRTTIYKDSITLNDYDIEDGTTLDLRSVCAYI